VCIPNVGTFEIVMQSPQLDVADKRISSPVYTVQHTANEHVPDHQFLFLTRDGIEHENLKHEFLAFGEKMKRQIKIAPFYWKGLGTLRFSSDEMLFEPEEIRLEALQTMQAERVLRKNVQHNVLVGDQEMTRQQVTEALTRVEYKRPWFIIVGWILLALSVIAIVFYLYTKNFQTTSTGLNRW
jgi:hypothetical protein